MALSLLKLYEREVASWVYFKVLEEVVIAPTEFSTIKG